jgi:hypothetical protein
MLFVKVPDGYEFVQGRNGDQFEEFYLDDFYDCLNDLFGAQLE